MLDDVPIEVPDVAVGAVLDETVLRVAVFDELDAHTAPQLSELDVPADARRVEVDCGDVTFIDSSGLGALVEFHRRTRHQGAEFELTARSAAVDRILSVTRLDVLLFG